MTEQQNKILNGLGIILILVGFFLFVRDFGENIFSHHLIHDPLIIGGLYLIHLAKKDGQVSEDDGRTDSYAILLLCAPTILGATAILVAQLFRPGWHMPLKTVTDRFVADLFVVGVPLALIGLPLIVFALFKGFLLIWRVGIRSSISKLVILILVTAIGASSYIVVKTIEYREQFQQKEINR
jgi:hypothetical protein